MSRSIAKVSQFPIFKDCDQFTGKGIDQIRGIHPDAKAVIKRLQPYHRGEKFAYHRLRRAAMRGEVHSNAGSGVYSAPAATLGSRMRSPQYRARAERYRWGIARLLVCQQLSALRRFSAMPSRSVIRTVSTRANFESIP